MLAHIVGGVQFEGERNGFSLKYKQKSKKNEPEKTNQGFVPFRSVLVRFYLFFAYISIKKQFFPLQ